MSLLNNLIAPFAPRVALRREVAEKKYSLLASADTRWRGASRSLRSLRSWVPGLGGPKQDLSPTERKTLTSRSRDAYRNFMIARAAINRGRTRIVGAGLRLRAAVDSAALGLTEEQGEELNTAFEREFRLWAENPRESDAESTLTFYQSQGLSLLSAMLSGDAFGLTPYRERPGCIYGLKFQLVEADRVCNPDSAQNTDTLVDGVVLDDMGSPERVYVQRTHPGDPYTGGGMDKWDSIDVFGRETGLRRVMHIINDKDRPGQVRGAPFLAPIIEPLKQIETYTGAELMAAVVSGMLTVFIERDAVEEDSTQKPWDDGSEQTTDSGASTDVEENELSLGNGAVLDLNAGERANLVNPARPNTSFDPFVGAIVKQIGATLEIPAEELMLFYSSSYSAARAAMLQAWHWYQMRRSWLVAQLCQPVYVLFLSEAVARGRVSVTGWDDPARRAAYSRAIWIGPARGTIQELQEAKAATERIRNGTSSIALEAGAAGHDWQEVHNQRVIERKARSEGGLENEQSEGEESIEEDKPIKEDQEKPTHE